MKRAKLKDCSSERDIEVAFQIRDLENGTFMQIAKIAKTAISEQSSIKEPIILVVQNLFFTTL